MCVCVHCRGSKGKGPWELGVETPRPAPRSASSGAHSLWHGRQQGLLFGSSLPSWAWLWAAGWHGAGPSAAAVGRSGRVWCRLCGVGGGSELVLLRGRRSSTPPSGAAPLHSSLWAARGSPGRASEVSFLRTGGEDRAGVSGSHSGECVHLSTSCTSPPAAPTACAAGHGPSKGTRRLGVRGLGCVPSWPLSAASPSLDHSQPNRNITRLASAHGGRAEPGVLWVSLPRTSAYPPSCHPPALPPPPSPGSSAHCRLGLPPGYSLILLSPVPGGGRQASVLCPCRLHKLPIMTTAPLSTPWLGIESPLKSMLTLPWPRQAPQPSRPVTPRFATCCSPSPRA